MPSKYYERNFIPHYHYHIFNRGSHKQNVFRQQNDYQVYIDILKYYLKFPTGQPLSIISRQTLPSSKTTPINKVRNLATATKSPSSFNLVAFCLMPNHLHLMVKQVTPPIAQNSIPNFMKRVTITYAMYFTKKYDHSGNLFQGKYKNILVETEPQLLHLTRYIHQNPQKLLSHNQPLKTYPYSSYPHYLGIKTKPWIKAEEILSYFSSKHPQLSYHSFIQDKAISTAPLSEISHLFLE